ncbi:hypothetical protein McPS_21130 [Marichromatium sp. PS1]
MGFGGSLLRSAWKALTDRSRVGVIALFGEQLTAAVRTGLADLIEKRLGMASAAVLAWGKQKAQGNALGIAEQVDLGHQAAATAPECMAHAIPAPLLFTPLAAA